MWYIKVGQRILLTLFLNIFSPHASKLALALLKGMRRCLDRRCRCRPEKANRSQDDLHDVNTRIKTQAELNELYTGDQIASHYVFAQSASYLLCVLMYSATMPILLPFAFFFYGLLFWVYKFLLLRFYERTTSFNEELPKQLPKWVKVALVVHGIATLVMLTNPALMPPSNPFEEREEFTDTRTLTLSILLENTRKRLLSRPYVIIYDISFTIGLILMFARETVLPPIFQLFSYMIR
jgi:hypothetical protein